LEIITNKIDIAKEILKCRYSALYFLETYIKIPVPGGYITQKESDIWNATPKYRRIVKMYESSNVNNILFMASRQHAKTTTIAQLILHALLFYPGLKIEMLTLTKKNAEDTIERIKFMYSHLPDWLKIASYKGRGDYKTYIELDNNARFNTRYISGNISPDTVARGMSVPMLWVDEAAFIPHFEEAWTAAQPAITTARRFALKNGYPSKIFMTSTPNGAGENFFYKMWANSWDYEDVWDFDKDLSKENADKIVNSSETKNNFIRIKIHWSETGKDEAWYKQQVKELNFNMRKVNQELNLVFLGSDAAIFDDEVLAAFEPAPIINKIDMGYGEYFNILENIDTILSENKDEVFILGVDTAVSTAASSDFSAIVLTRASTGEQIGEWHGKISVLKRYAVILKKLILSLIKLYGLHEDNLKVVIERNSIGLAVIEDLLYDDEFDFNDFLYKTEIRKGEKAPGIATKKDTREKMYDLLLSLINENPKRIKGPLLQEELRNLEQKQNGRIEASKGAHDDTVMAYNFTLFVRDELIKKGIIINDEGISRYDPTKIKYDINIALSSLQTFQKKEKLEIETKIIIDEEYERKEKKRIMEEIGWKPKYEDDNFMYEIVSF
jgi:hypothetical protein